jgi:hypothetical protein
MWIQRQKGNVCRILQLADISSSFVVVGSKRENMIRRWTFGSKLLGRVRADSDAQKSSR